MCIRDSRKAAKKADKIYLATDPDREGEAISWHLMQALKEDPKKMHRITFNEITKKAVKSSIKQARDLDMDLVDAQQARRMLDRMVGYTTVSYTHLSPVCLLPVRLSNIHQPGQDHLCLHSRAREILSQE